MSVFYYDNHGNVYPTRYEAMVSPHPCWWYFHDKELLAIDWTKEPVDDIETLYRRRAQSIRDTFEHVILAYSGGIDSTKMLEIFYYNGIRIDEILMVGAFSQDSAAGVDENHNGELYHNAFPTLRKLSLPNTRITVADYTKHFSKPEIFPLIKKAGTEWYKEIGHYLSVHHLFWNGVRSFVPSSKKTAIVFAQEKRPHVYSDQETGKFCLDFRDDNYTDYGSLPHFASKDAQERACVASKDARERAYHGDYWRVNFYTSLESMDLVRKQAHMLMAYRRAGGRLEAKCIMKLLHGDLRHPLAFESKKSVTNILSVRDMFMVGKRGTAIHDLYTTGIRRYHAEFRRHNGALAQMRPIYTRKYFLE